MKKAERIPRSSTERETERYKKKGVAKATRVRSGRNLRETEGERSGDPAQRAKEASNGED